MDRQEATPIPHVGIDEKSFGKGHDSITVLTDVDGFRVLDVVQERTQAAAEAVLQTLTVEQRQEVRAVAADMLPAYAKAVARQTPNATLVHDKFHVSKYLGTAVDQVRRAENKALQAEGDERLKGTRHLWLFNKSNLSYRQRRRFAAIRQNGLKTAKAWAIKEEFRWFWRHVYSTSAEKFFRRWYAWGVRSRLQPNGQSGEDAQAASAKPSELLPLSNHECHERRLQQRHPGLEIRSPRLQVFQEL